MLLIHVLFLTWSACFGSIAFICHVVTAGISQLVLILSLIFGWTLSVQDVSLISFGRKFCNLFFGSIWFLRLLFIHVLFLTWSASFWSIVFICYVVSAGSSSQYWVWYLVEHYVFKMFHWYLLVGNFVIFLGLIWFLEIAFDTCSVFDLICQFWVNSVYLLCCFSMKFFSIGIAINFDIWLNIIYSRCFIDIFW